MPAPSEFSAKSVPMPMPPFRKAVLRGLGILLPPLLTIVIFVWVANTVVIYLLDPLEAGAEWLLVRSTADIRTGLAISNPQEGTAIVGETVYHVTGDEKFVPLEVYQAVQHQLGLALLPPTASGIYSEYVQLRYLERRIVVPTFLCVFILLLYLLGKFMAAGVGIFFWARFELLIHRLPLIRNVYSSVKQITDYLFGNQQVEYTRVVAVEYPRKGIWALAFVTGEGMLDIRSSANEEVISLLIPTSPMPFTGFTVMALKSEVLDLNITIEQAFQYIISCGVVVPSHQLLNSASVLAPPVLNLTAGNLSTADNVVKE